MTENESNQEYMEWLQSPSLQEEYNEWMQKNEAEKLKKLDPNFQNQFNQIFGVNK